MSRSARPGFTLPEALISLAILSLAASVLLLACESALQTSSDCVDAQIAQGWARQIADEAITRRYMAEGTPPNQWPLGPSTYEQSGAGRERFDDLGDFHQHTAQPLEDRWGLPLAQGDGQGGQRPADFQLGHNYFQNWRQEVEVYYVDPQDWTRRLPSGQTSDFRAIEVRVSRTDPDNVSRLLARVRRVCPYVTPPLN